MHEDEKMALWVAAAVVVIGLSVTGGIAWLIIWAVKTIATAIVS